MTQNFYSPHLPCSYSAAELYRPLATLPQSEQKARQTSGLGTFLQEVTHDTQVKFLPRTPVAQGLPGSQEQILTDYLRSVSCLIGFI